MSAVPQDRISSVTETHPSAQQTPSSFDHVSQTKSKEPLRIAVIGGGMGGLSLAIGLLQYPHLDVQVYESAHKFAEIGAGVAFGPNAQRAMALIGPHVEQAYLNQATHNQWPSYKNTWFEFREGMGPNEGNLLAAPQNETGQSTVHRAHFLDEFVSLIPPERAHFGKRLVGITDQGDGKPLVLRFKDGTTVEADAMIGADGVHSYTRSYLLGPDHPAVQPQYTGSVAYRGLIPMDKAVEAIGPELAQNSFNWCGQGGIVMTYPINFGDIMNVVALTWEHKTWENHDWVIPVSVEDVLKDFQGWGPHVTKVLKLLDHPSAWSMWDSLPAPYYNKGRVCMMGDGAHASTPYQGQGAGQAIEDALVIETLLGLVQDVDNIQYAFAAYDQVRRPRSQKNVTTSREAGVTFSYQDPVIGHDIEKLTESMNSRMDWLWHKDLKQQNEDAINLMNKFINEA